MMLLNYRCPQKISLINNCTTKTYISLKDKTAHNKHGRKNSL